MADAYDVLGVAPNADKQTCKEAYRKLASKHHPDKGGDKNTFQQIQAAWDSIENGYRRVTARPQNPKSQYHHNTRKPSFNDTADFWKHVHAQNTTRQHTTFNNGAQVIDVKASMETYEHFEGDHVFDIPGGLPQGHVIKVRSRHILTGYDSNYRSIDKTFEINLVNTMDKSMRVTNDTHFNKIVGNVHCRIKTNALNLCTGAWVTIRDIMGESKTFRIPEGFNPENVIRLAGSGWTVYDTDSGVVKKGERGDMYISITPDFKAWKDMSAADQANAKEFFEGK